MGHPLAMFFGWQGGIGAQRHEAGIFNANDR
jgi:hypothetical protein